VSELAVISASNDVQWRFYPHLHKVEEDIVITPRRARYPPVPIGSELVDVETTEVIGTVTAVIAVQFDRYEIHYAQPEVEEAEEAEAAEADEAKEEAGEPESEEAGETEEQAEAEVEEAEAEELDVEPLTSLALSPRVLSALEDADVVTVEELRAIAEAGELGDISGIGPASLEEIEAALQEDEADE
jgi:DNA-directed RNA polymerase alpha subunit